MKPLDPRNYLNKVKIKASITDAIAKHVVGSDRDDIAQRVEEEYERLLAGASIVAHVPSLTAGSVRRDVIASRRSKESTSATS